MNNPNCEKLFYVVHYIWKDTHKKKFVAVFLECSDAMQFMKTHVDDNVNLEWTVRKMSKIELIDMIEEV